MDFFSLSDGFFSDSFFSLLPHFTQIRDTSCLKVRLSGMRSTFAHTFESIALSNIAEEKKKAFVFPCEMSSGSMWSKACTTPIWQKAEMTKPALTLIWDVCSQFWASIDRYVSILTDIYTKMDTDASLYTSNGYSTVIDAASEWNICQMKYVNDGFTCVALT